MLVALRLKKTTKVFDFQVAKALFEGNEKIGRAEIAIVFRNFVFEDEMIPPSVPGEIGKDAVVLMAVVPLMSEDDVGLDLFQSLKEPLDAFAFVGKEARAELFGDNL